MGLWEKEQVTDWAVTTVESMPYRYLQRKVMYIKANFCLRMLSVRHIKHACCIQEKCLTTPLTSNWPSIRLPSLHCMNAIMNICKTVWVCVRMYTSTMYVVPDAAFECITHNPCILFNMRAFPCSAKSSQEQRKIFTKRDIHSLPCIWPVRGVQEGTGMCVCIHACAYRLPVVLHQGLLVLNAAGARGENHVLHATCTWSGQNSRHVQEPTDEKCFLLSGVSLNFRQVH